MAYSQILETPSRVIYGAYPSQERVVELTAEHINVFVDLTEYNEEGTVPYQADRVIKFPIPNGYPPNDWEAYSKFITSLGALIKDGLNVYLHCRAGHGRSSTVCVSLICYLEPDLHPELAIKRVADIHSKRDGLSARWSKMYNPLTRSQQIFIYKFFSTIFFTRAFDKTYQMGFSSLSTNPITLSNDLVFPSAEAAFQYLKDTGDDVYREKLLDPRKFSLVKLIGDDHWLKEPSEFDNYEVMYKVLKLKYEQHPYLGEVLKKTYLKRLYDGCFHSHPNNLVGKILMRLRDELI